MNSHYNSVTDWLLVGGDLDLARDLTGQDPQTTIANFRSLGVTHVLDVRSEWEDRSAWIAGGLIPENYCHAPIVDSWSHIPSENWFSTVEDFVSQFWLDSVEGDSLLVMCHMGINRSPSAAMLALLTVDPLLHPLDAFMQVRRARPIAGMVYAEAVGVRHLLNAEGVSAEDLTAGRGLPASVRRFGASMSAYWTPEMRDAVHRGISYYRTQEGGTKVVDTSPV